MKINDAYCQVSGYKFYYLACPLIKAYAPLEASLLQDIEASI